MLSLQRFQLVARFRKDLPQLGPKRAVETFAVATGVGKDKAALFHIPPQLLPLLRGEAKGVTAGKKQDGRLRVVVGRGLFRIHGLPGQWHLPFSLGISSQVEQVVPHQVPVTVPAELGDQHRPAALGEKQQSQRRADLRMLGDVPLPGTVRVLLADQEVGPFAIPVVTLKVPLVAAVPAVKESSRRDAAHPFNAVQVIVQPSLGPDGRAPHHFLRVARH